MMQNDNIQSLSLFELNQLIKEKLADAFPLPVWVRAEISEFRENANGHCYLELIDKENHNDRIAAKMKAMIWSSTYKLLRAYFEATTGEAMRAGIKILAACNIEFHELYGISLIIQDIDPIFTLGEMATRRLELLKQLEAEGMLNMNKQLSFPFLPQRIAVISSQTAAGYGDFVDQLHQNRFGYMFYTHLFPAVMQGDLTEQSVITALDAIFDHVQHFDVVVILRGGGAVADLSSFDRYLLAAHCAQFPIPVLTGIGHFRDDTLIDHVAFASLKTPTAVAEFLIDKFQYAHDLLLQDIDILKGKVAILYQGQVEQLQRITRSLPSLLMGRTTSQKEDLIRKLSVLHRISTQQISVCQQNVTRLNNLLRSDMKQKITDHHHALGLLENKLKYVNPVAILEKGYCLASVAGKRVVSKSSVQEGDIMKVGFFDGVITTKVTER
ncbi:exodeoxyribonuclease VII large subunit [Microbacter margulisiae]|uniref:Exodeoxyribonuclease 7 large subunit n=1 Tax=Microbacter margulisiae TaxID=1350067 RepID=A0A7W5H169_9PORP|nr:exodeoxyribonuclease VII large subunit [Microbacter margulisiae]MBB3186051.1 exodeoxyribonuclease VII large subunit [Microbacter margulisiae]